VDIVDNIVTDHDAPIYSSECPQGQEGCSTIGYDTKVEGKKLVNNPEKLAAFEAKKAQDDILNAKVQEAAAERQKGISIINHFRALNKLKQLSPAQRKAIRDNATIKQVMEALSVGDLQDAKTLIQGITPDGTLITADDKAKVLELLN